MVSSPLTVLGISCNPLAPPPTHGIGHAITTTLLSLILALHTFITSSLPLTADLALAFPPTSPCMAHPNSAGVRVYGNTPMCPHGPLSCASTP